MPGDDFEDDYVSDSDVPIYSEDEGQPLEEVEQIENNAPASGSGPSAEEKAQSKKRKRREKEKEKRAKVRSIQFIYGFSFLCPIS